MINLNIQDKQYLFPQTWEEVKLKQYMNIQPILRKEKDESMKIVEIIAALSDIPYETILDLEISSLGKVFNLVDKLLQSEVKNAPETFKIGNKEYIFALKDRKLTMREYIDLDLLCKDLDENLDKIMAILYRENENGIIPYKTEDLESRAKLFYDEITADYVLKGASFFFRLQVQSVVSFLENKQREIMKQIVETRRKKLKVLMSNGFGT